MLVNYNNIKFVVDPDIDFLMTEFCYENGNNCFTCRLPCLGECPCEDLTIEELISNGSEV